MAHAAMTLANRVIPMASGANMLFDGWFFDGSSSPGPSRPVPSG